MLDQSLLQSHFIGRDGFRWWMGQIPPLDDVWSQQTNGSGWGNRCKVRILGYHPLDEQSLKNEDLPWAQIMLPTTTGSGASNFAKPPKVRPGDVVIGFFMDGDNAQIPVIMGILGRTTEYSTAEYTNPFTPFTGYTTNITNDGSKVYNDQTNENKAESQISPRILEKEKIDQKNQQKVAAGGEPNERSASSVVGKEIVFADTCEDTSFKEIKNTVKNLIKDLQDLQKSIDEKRQKINKAVDKITSSLNWIVGKMLDYLYVTLCGDENHKPEPIPGLIPEALKALYDSVFGATLAATGNPGQAQQIATGALEPFVPIVKTLEEAIACVVGKILELIKSVVKELLNSLIQNVKNVTSCVIEQFMASLVNNIINAVADALSSALSGVASLLGGTLNVVELLQGSVDAIKAIGGLFDCNQDKGKCSGRVKEWVIGYGPKDTVNANDAFNNILQSVNTISATAQELATNIESGAGTATGTIDLITNTIDVFNPESIFNDAVNAVSSCFYGIPTSCSPPVFNIFGGGGTGAMGIPILGSIRSFQQVGETINNVQNTASVIGGLITNGGSGYTSSPSVTITDSCNLGYGAIAKAIINDQGEVTSIYVVSPGEGYPFGDQDTSGITDVYIESPGSGYSNGDTAIDNLGNTYALTVDNGRIISANPINIVEATEFPIIRVNSKTGSGAILRPVFGSTKNISQKEINKQIDCII
jgi:hypothetical protein